MQALHTPEHPEAVPPLRDKAVIQRLHITTPGAILHLQAARRAARHTLLPGRHTNLHQAAHTAQDHHHLVETTHQDRALLAAILQVLHRQVLPDPLHHRAAAHPGEDDKNKLVLISF